MTGVRGAICLLWLLTFRLTGAAVLPIDSFQVDGTRLVLKPGTVPGSSLPPELGTFSNLTRIELIGRGLSGPIPPELGNLTELEYLDLSKNSLTGTIPAELGKLGNLVTLNLSVNSLSGPIPPQIGNLGSLSWFNLFANRILSGGIPPELGNLTNLVYLNLASMSLSGKLPTTLGKLTNLKEVFLYENQLTGGIIDELGNMPNLVTLSLSNNSLSGPVPPSLGNYKLSTVLLANNSLSGLIPQALVRRLKSNLTYVCLYIRRGNPELNLDPLSGQCPTSAPVVETPSPSPPIIPLVPAPIAADPPSPSSAPSPPPPNPPQIGPTESKNMAKLLGLALALPTGLLSFGLTVAFFAVEVRKHRKAKQAIVRDAIKLCRTGARHIPNAGTAEDTQPLERPHGITDKEFDDILTTILNSVLQRLEAWPKSLGLRGDPNEAVWAQNFRRFEHYVLFLALVDADSKYRSKSVKGLLETWDTSRLNPEDLGTIIDSIYAYLGSMLHDKWTGRVEELLGKMSV